MHLILDTFNISHLKDSGVIKMGDFHFHKCNNLG